MKKISKKNLAKLFENLCCSDCKADFDENSIDIIRNENDGLIAVKLTCSKCGKGFGMAFLGLKKENFKYYETSDENVSLEIMDLDDPITEEEVLEAGKFIQALDSDWQKYI
jgi:hypothetical protein